MAMNWGAFAGGAASAALGTYSQLNAERMKNLQTATLMEDLAEKQAFQQSVRDQYAIKTPEGGAASANVFDQGVKYETPEVQEAVRSQVASLTPEQQQDVFRKLKGTSVDVRAQALPVDTAGATGGSPTPEKKAGLDLGQVQVYKNKEGETLATTEGKVRSAEQIMRGVMDDMYKSGNMAGYQRAAGVYKLAREVSASDALDKVMEDVREKTTLFQDTLDKYGMVGTVEKLGDQFKKYGVNLSVVKGPDGKDAVAVMGPDGKPQQVFANSAQMSGAFDNLMMKSTMDRVMQLPGHNPKDLMSMMKDKAQGNYYDKKSMLDEVLQPYQIAMLQAQTAHHNASANAARAGMNALGTPIGTDPNGAPVYQSKNGPSYGDGTKVDPKMELTPWNQQRGFVPQLSMQNVTIKGDGGKDSIMPVQIVSSMGRDNTPQIKVFGLDGKEITDPAVIKQIGVKQEPKQLTEWEKLQAPKWNDAVTNLGPKATQAQLIELAKKMGIRPEIVGLPEQPQSQSRLSGTNVPVDQGGLGAPKGSTAPAPKQTAPTTALPKVTTPSVGSQNTAKLVEQIQTELPEMTVERAQELIDSRGFYALPSNLQRELRIKAAKQRAIPEQPSSTLYAPR